MTTIKNDIITITVGYYEHNLCINGKVVYTLDGDCSEYWFENNPKDCAEMYVNSILTELKDSNSQANYELVLKNKDKVITVLTEYIINWIS